MRSAGTPARTFNLRLWFAICSLGTIAVICALSAHFLTQYMTNSLLQREGTLSQEFLESIVNVNGADTFRDDEDPVNTQNPMLLDLAAHLLSMPGVVRVNIHARSHRVLWSTERQLVGQVFTDNDELDEAFKGTIVTEISSLDSDDKGEHIALGVTGRIIESYIPLRSDAGKGPIVGVVEFYRLPLALDVMLRQGERTLWLSALAAASLLYLVLYWIVQRGAVVIERQQESLGHMEAMAAIGQMASAVAHSLRNPMSAIRSSAELWHAQQPIDNREVTDEVIAEVDRMDRYVRDLLAYSRSEPAQSRPTNAQKVIDSIFERQARVAQRHNIKIIRTGLEPDVRVLADEHLLEQALTSLVTNSLEAMPEGGTLEANITRLSKDRIRIMVSDTGRGIAPELLDRVTDSYFTTKTRGLGLGLVLTKGIIERFGGSMSITSTLGEGTNISVELKEA